MPTNKKVLNKKDRDGKWRGYPYTPKQDLELLKLAHKKRSYDTGLGNLTESFELILGSMKGMGLFNNVSEGYPTPLGLLCRFRRMIRIGSDVYRRHYRKSHDSIEINAIVNQVCILINACAEDIASLPPPAKATRNSDGRDRTLRGSCSQALPEACKRSKRPGHQFEKKETPEYPRHPGRSRTQPSDRTDASQDAGKYRGHDTGSAEHNCSESNNRNDDGPNGPGATRRDPSFVWSDGDFDHHLEEIFDDLPYGSDSELDKRTSGRQARRIEFREMKLNQEPLFSLTDAPQLDSDIHCAGEAEGSVPVLLPELEESSSDHAPKTDAQEFQGKPKRRKTNHIGGYKYEPPVGLRIREDSGSRLENWEEHLEPTRAHVDNINPARDCDVIEDLSPEPLSGAMNSSQARHMSHTVLNARVELRRLQVEHERLHRNYRLQQMRFEDRQMIREHEERKREMVIREITCLHNAYLVALQKLVEL